MVMIWACFLVFESVILSRKGTLCHVCINKITGKSESFYQQNSFSSCFVHHGPIIIDALALNFW